MSVKDLLTDLLSDVPCDPETRKAAIALRDRLENSLHNESEALRTSPEKMKYDDYAFEEPVYDER